MSELGNTKWMKVQDQLAKCLSLLRGNREAVLGPQIAVQNRRELGILMRNKVEESEHIPCGKKCNLKDVVPT